MKVKLGWIESWKNKIWHQGHDVGFEDGRVVGRDEAASICMEETKRASQEIFKNGREFEFRTINDHMQDMFKAKMSENVEWVVQRFREDKTPKDIIVMSPWEVASVKAVREQYTEIASRNSFDNG